MDELVDTVEELEEDGRETSLIVDCVIVSASESLKFIFVFKKFFIFIEI